MEGKRGPKHWVQRGLNNNTILSLFQDKKDNLWLGLDIGVSKNLFYLNCIFA